MPLAVPPDHLDRQAREALAEPIALAPWSPRWARAFATERRRLLSRFADRLLEIRHVGSTAVPGLSAKPVIDLIAGVRSMDAANALVEPLCGFGYWFQAEGNAPFQDRRWLFRQCDGHRTHHLHLVVWRGRAWNERVAFCETLRRDPALRARYEALKQSLADAHNDDRDSYNAGKQGFILEAIAASRAG